MPIIQPNLADVISNDPPVGTWPAKIVELEDTVSKKGNPMLVVSFQIDADGAKYELRAFLVYTGRAAYGFENLLRAARFSDVADQLRRGEPLNFNTDDLMDQKVQVVVVEEPDQTGQIRKNIKSFLPN